MVYWASGFAQVLVPMYACADNDEYIGKFTRFSLSNIDREMGCHAYDLQYDLFAVPS